MPFIRGLSFLVAVLFVATFAHADDLTTTTGKKISGSLVAVDSGSVTLSTNSSELKVSSKEIHIIDLGHKVELPPKDARYHELELTDGSIFRIAKYAVKGKTVSAELLAGPNGVAQPKLEIGLRSVFSVMRGADDPKNREAWKRVLASRGKRDLYVVREAEGLNFVYGTILGGNDAGDLLSFEKEDNTVIELKQSRATGGLVLATPPPAQVAPTLCKVIDVFGDVLIAQSVSVGKSGVVVTTVNGTVVKYETASAIAKLDYAQGNLAYLSDLDPQVDAPGKAPDEKGLRLDAAAPYTKDRGVSNDALKLGSDPPYPKGITIAPDTKLTFNIGGDYREFKTVVGIQETTPDANLEAKLIIETEEGRVLFSEVIKRKDKPKSITLDVKGVKQLLIFVDADSPAVGNRVVLADARVQK